MGRKAYNNTTLKSMHTADSWRTYKYIYNATGYDSIIPHHEFNINEQTCLDSYFWRIKDEITDKLEIKHRQILHTIDANYKLNPLNYCKEKYFSDLLTPMKSDKPSQLSIDDKIHEILYWYPFDIIDGENTPVHLGTPSFNTMLAGTVTLRKNVTTPFPNTIIAKFTHPLPGKKIKNDYSYGILIDSKSASGHYNCGWIIYQNVCSNYSGFSVMEYTETEKLIKKYIEQGNVELRELHVPLDIFKEVTEKEVNNKAHINSYTSNKNANDIIQKSRAYCFELFTYYLHSRYYKDRFHTIALNTNKKSPSGERDVVLWNNTEVLLIECKLNPNNQNLENEIEKIKYKLSEYTHLKKSFQFWFWHEPSTQNESILKKNNITYIVVSVPSKEPILKGVGLDQLRFIMNNSGADIVY